MKLKCTASIGDIYWQVNEKSAEGFKSKRDSNTVYNTFVSEEDGPQGKKHTAQCSERNQNVQKLLYRLNNIEIRLVCVHRPKTAFLD